MTFKLDEPRIGVEEIEAVNRVLQSGWLSEGAVTRSFEEKIAKYIGASYAVATTSCTTALYLALKSLGIKQGDEVILPDFTHPATGNVVKWLGATPVLVDVDIDSYNISYTQLSKAITKRTKCIIPVSWGGNPLNLTHLKTILNNIKSNISIVEDAACSLGSSYSDIKTGNLANITCFSMHPRKVITTGEGGMIVTNNCKIMYKLRRLKFFGSEKISNEYKFLSEGLNFKLSDINSAIGLVQLDKLNKIIDKRIQMARYYSDALISSKLIDLKLKIPYYDEEAYHTFQTYAIYIMKEGIRDKIIQKLKIKGIETQIGTYALHLQPYYFGSTTKKVGKLENSTKLYRNLLALPMSYTMTQENQNTVIDELEKILRGR